MALAASQTGAPLRGISNDNMQSTRHVQEVRLPPDFSRSESFRASTLRLCSHMAVTWQSQPNSAHTATRTRRLASGPTRSTATPQPIKLLPPATPYCGRIRRRSTGYHRVGSVDVVSLSGDGGGRRKSYALFSPYVPLPAIGGEGKEDDKVMDNKSEDDGPDNGDRPRYLRERTYSVIEPVFVRGPVRSIHQWAQPVRANDGAWFRQAERPRMPSPSRLPSLADIQNARRKRRPSSPEMLDDVQLPVFPQDIDLDDNEVLSEELVSVESASKNSDTSVKTEVIESPKPEVNQSLPETTEARNSKLVNDVTDSLKRMWTRL